MPQKRGSPFIREQPEPKASAGTPLIQHPHATALLVWLRVPRKSPVP